MGSEFNEQELQSCLAKSVIVCGLRDILTKMGIQADETIKFHIKYNDEILVSQEIPKKSPKIVVVRQTTDFVEEIIDFFNRAEAFAGLLSMLPTSPPSMDGITETQYQLIFDIGSFHLGEPSNRPQRLRTIVNIASRCPCGSLPYCAC